MVRLLIGDWRNLQHLDLSNNCLDCHATENLDLFEFAALETLNLQGNDVLNIVGISGLVGCLWPMLKVLDLRCKDPLKLLSTSDLRLLLVNRWCKLDCLKLSVADFVRVVQMLGSKASWNAHQGMYEVTTQLFSYSPFLKTILFDQGRDSKTAC